MLLSRAAGPINATITPPPSKSITHRALVAAALRGGRTLVRGPLDAEDTRLTAAALTALGAPVELGAEAWTVTGFREERPVPGDDPVAAGSGPNVAGAGDSVSPILLDVGNSGTSLRLLLPLAALGSVPVVLDGSPRMRRRPIGAQVAALRVLGAQVDELGQPGCPPVRVCGPIHGGRVEVDAGASSQVVSGLLMAAAGLQDRLTVKALGLSSRPYVDLTSSVLNQFGFQVDEPEENAWSTRPAGPSAGPGLFTYQVEPDASAAAFLLAAGVVTGGQVAISGLGTLSRQGDIAFLDDLASMGCRVAGNARSLLAGGRPTTGIQADLNATPDLVPPLAAVALLAPGPSRLTGIGHLRGKESDRLAALAGEFSRLGGNVTAGPDTLEIIPAPLHGATVSAHDDHRIAMALAIVGLCVEGVELDTPDCVGKSYPAFFRDLDRMIAG